MRHLQRLSRNRRLHSPRTKRRPAAADVGQRLHRIVVVGGGAGGLELTTQLGDRLGKRGKAEVTLVERARTHLWKPLLHEVAAGSMDLDDHAWIIWPRPTGTVSASARRDDRSRPSRPSACGWPPATTMRAG